MILDSKSIEEKALVTRKKLTETQALVAEAMVRGQPFEEMMTALDIDMGEIEFIAGLYLVNCYFWQLVAAYNTREGEVFRDSHDAQKISDPVNANPARVLH